MNRYSLAFVAVGLASPLSIAAPAKPDFNRDVRPILADTCFTCHGPDEKTRKAKLRLDTRDGLLGVVKPGDPAKSALVSRITAHDVAEQMPPAKSGKKLTADQITILKSWVEQGAAWSTHWAFEPLKRPAVPELRTPNAQPRNAIDNFVLARLEREGLKPSPEAARETLIRRMSFDLTGLGPTPAEVDAFVKDTSPDAVAKLADRLLASPRYGERMAWRWLEAARYADTNGYQTDAERDMWRWRDWVIEAYNRNLPFDQFTIEQLAGDMLPKPTLDQRIATGFNRNHRGNSEGGIVPEEYAVEYVVDRVETTSTVWLGLTLGCARCHDHKFDPFSQREFYQLFAYFNNVPEKGRAVKFGNSPPYIKAPTREQAKKLAELDAKLKDAETKWRDVEKKLPEAISTWERDGVFVVNWLPDRGLVDFRWFSDIERDEVRDGKPSYAPGRTGQSLVFDGKLFATTDKLADFGYDDRFSFSVWVKPAKLTGAILSRMPQESQAEGYSVELIDGKVRVALTKRWLDDALRVETAAAVQADRWQHIAVSYDGSRLAAGVKVFVNGIEQKNRVLLDELNQTFKNKEPLRIGTAGGKDTRFTGQMDSFRVYDRVLEPGEVAVLAVPASVAEILGKHPANRTPEEQGKLTAYFLAVPAPPEFSKPFLALRALLEEHAAFWHAVPTVMVMEEMPTPRDTFLLKRGEYDKPGDKVQAAVPAALPTFPKDTPNNRLGLARWLVDPANPLTARVAVNRMWQLHFGKGLVRTVEDFGTQGDFPSHPELLDWLAAEFIASGWNVKHMHKLIVTSATYRQSSRIRNAEFGMRNPETISAIVARFGVFIPHSAFRIPHFEDGENRLLARGPRLRLSAEMLRDQALFAGGLLVEKQGGPSVKPYQPAGLWDELSGAGDYKQDSGENLFRRSLYTYWKRTVAPPTIAGFDAATRETCWVRETRTNTPLHALTLLNDVTFVEAARGLAERVMKEEKTPEKRLALAFRHLTARAPKEQELKVLIAAFERQHAEFVKNPPAATKLLSLGESPRDKKLNSPEFAAYATVCSLLMNLDEAVTKE